MSATKNTSKDDTKGEAIKKANTKKAAMKNVGHEIAEFGVKNMAAGSKASRGAGKPKTPISVNEPSKKSGPSKAAFGGVGKGGQKKKSF